MFGGDFGDVSVLGGVANVLAVVRMGMSLEGVSTGCL